MWHIGLDYHLRTSSLHILDENGRKINAFTVRGGWKELIEALGPVVQQAREAGQKVAICYEASCGSGHLFDRLARFIDRVVVAHPGHLRLIFHAKRKTDRIDAQKLAKLLAMDMVPTVWMPRLEVRAWRAMIEHRRTTMDKRTAVKNQIRAVLRTYGVAGPPRGKLWAAKQRPWLRQLELPSEEARLQLDMLVDDLEHLERQVTRVTRELDRRGRQHPGVAVLRTIAGVGPRTAEVLVAYIDEATRFKRTKQIGAYFGLVPCQDSSAGRDRLGHITRQGPATARKMLTEAALQGIRCSPKIRAFYQRVADNHGHDGHKIAVVATAHWLARVALAMLRSGEPWRPDQTQDTTSPSTAAA